MDKQVFTHRFLGAVCVFLCNALLLGILLNLRLIIFVLRNPINTNRYTTILLDIDETEPYPMAAKVFAWSIARIKNA